MTLAQIMKMAHTLRKALRCGMSVALRMAWAYRRGFSHAYEISWANGTRSLGFGRSYDEVRRACVIEVRDAYYINGLPIGLAAIGSHETNMQPYAPAVEPVAVPLPIAA